MRRCAVGMFALAFRSAVLARADLAEANSDGPLDQPGGVCVPDSSTIRAGGYETRGFRHAGIGTNVAVTDATCNSNTSDTTGPHNMACFFHGEPLKINFLLV